MKDKLNRKEIGRFFRFALVGAIGAIVDFGVFNILTLFALIPALHSSIISFLVAVSSNFFWNRYWTYPDSRSKPIQHQLFQFLVVSIIGLGIRTPLFSWIEEIFIEYSSNQFFPADISPITIGHNLSLAFVIGVVMLWNFLANRIWTYSDIPS